MLLFHPLSEHTVPNVQRIKSYLYFRDYIEQKLRRIEILTINSGDYVVLKLLQARRI